MFIRTWISRGLPRLSVGSVRCVTSFPTNDGLDQIADLLEGEAMTTQASTDAVASIKTPWAGQLGERMAERRGAKTTRDPISRQWRLGQVQNPGEFHRDHRMRPEKRRIKRTIATASEAKQSDPFHQFGFDPLKECRNVQLLGNFMTELGKINGRRVTGLTWKSQRRVTKAIRRAQNMGIMPLMSRSKREFLG